ncbi:MAG: Gfo/Idh/MocA family oxidoreductase [Anaerolineaceae bacterium]|nr:Gfo/Idh/MocA family oxidoreductase [Anaerolineaceae bacterium]
MTSKTLRALLVGCGGISQAWIESIQHIPQVELVGMVDLYLESAKARCEQYQLDVPIGTDMVEMIETLHPDVVFDCTIPEAHVTVACTAMEHGCDVFGEKPLADSMDNARKIVETAKRTGKIHAVMQNRRYLPDARRTQAFLKSEKLGKLTTINSDFYLGAHFDGFRKTMPHVLLLDMAIHTLDLGRMLADAVPVAVYCKEWNPSGSWYERDASAVAIFEFDNGVVYTYRGSWTSEGANTTWESDWRLIGEQGTILWNGGDEFTVDYVAKPEGFTSTPERLEMPPLAEGVLVGGHKAAIESYVNAVLAGKTPETVCTDNIKSLAMVFGAIESAESGREVKIQI